MTSIIDKIKSDLQNTIINSPLLLRQYRNAVTGDIDAKINSPLLLKQYRSSIKDIDDLKKLVDYYNNYLSKGKIDPTLQAEMMKFLERTNDTYISLLKQLETQLANQSPQEFYASLSDTHKQLLKNIMSDLSNESKYPNMQNLLKKINVMSRTGNF